MDRTSILVLVICFVVLMLWIPFVNKLYPPKPVPAAATNAVTSATSSNNRPTIGATGQVQSASSRSTSSTPTARMAITNASESTENLITLTNGDARYTFSSLGGGIKTVELFNYSNTVFISRLSKSEPTRLATLNLNAENPAMSFLGLETLEGDGVYNLSKTDRGGVRAEKVLANGISMVKDFELGSNYLMHLTVQMENHTGTNTGVPSMDWIVGTAAPMDARDNGQAVGVMWYNGSKTEDLNGGGLFSPSGFMCSARIPPTRHEAGSNNVFWAAAHNQFFALVAMPTQPAQSLAIRRLDLPRPTGEEAKLVSSTGPPPQGYQAAITFPSLTFTNGEVYKQEMNIYAGPKEYQTLSRVADRFSNNVDQMMNFGWWGFVSKALLLAMNWMNQALRIPYGWAIVGITFTIKMIFWPLTASATRSGKRMQALQPQIKAMQEKYKDDPMKAQKKMMEFYKENKINPMGSCLPMLLQIPVFFGFFRMIQGAIELRGAHWLWVTDLSKPDTLFIIPGIPFIGNSGGLPFNILPLLMGATMLWQARLTPQAPGMDPTQQKIMKYMPLMFLVGLYNFSAGMTLYWTTSNLMTILQTKLTRTVDKPGADAKASPAPALTGPPKKKK